MPNLSSYVQSISYTAKSSLSISLAFTMCLGVVGCRDQHSSDATTSTTPTAPSTLKILHINDHHSHLDEEQMELSIDNDQGQSTTYTVSRGGFARVAALIKQLETKTEPQLKLHAGDATTGDLYYTLSKGQADADLMNTVCFDAFTIGNHEFDGKDKGLKTFIDALDRGQCAKPTAVLSANVQFGPSSVLYQSSRVQKSTVIETQGQKIGLVGLTIAQKTKNASQPNADTLFLDELSSAQQEIDHLRQAGINKIVLQSHVGFEMDKVLATQLRGVDVIVGGDSHTLLGPSELSRYGITPEASYPTQLRNGDGDPVCIVQAWQYSYVVGELNVNFDAQGRVKSCQGTPHILIGNDFQPKQRGLAPLTTQQQTQLGETLMQRAPAFRVIQPDAMALSILKPYRERKTQFSQSLVAYADEIFCLRRVPGTQRDINRSGLGDICNQDAHVNQYGGDIQQLVAEAFLQQGKSYFAADLSLLNGGGVRTDLDRGEISVARVYQVLPYNSTLVQLNMRGSEIKAALEDALDAVIRLNNTGSYPYSAGLRWTVDMNQNKGERIGNLELQTPSGHYTPLHMEQRYRVVTLDFLANGSDYYHTLATIKGEHRIDVGLEYADAFLQYLQRNHDVRPTLNKLATAQYSTQQFIDRPL
ncbi:UNVERIFIED_CONTAM: bifunctional metallophosphatase/5'-nucleotidase [Acinetobacter sp. HSTU-ASm16]